MGAYKYIHANYNETPDVNKVAASVHLSTPLSAVISKSKRK